MADEDEIILSELSDDELVLQMHDDLYDGLKEEIEEAVNILIAFVIFAAGATISLFVWADLPLVALGFAALAGSLVLGARQWR